MKKEINRFRKVEVKGILSVVALSGLLSLTGCSFNRTSDGNINNSNVAYAVPERIASDNVEVRRKPTRPSWTEDKLDKEDLIIQEDAIQEEYYIVRRGDTVYGIARKLGIPARELMNLNGFNNDSRLFVGQKIRLPMGMKSSIDKEAITESDQSAAREVTTYVVQRGDSLYKIAKNNDMTVDELKALNGIISDKIYIGQTVKIYKKGSSKSVVSEPKEQKKSKIEEPKKVNQHAFVRDPDGYYTVQPGDTLGKIAHGFRVSLERLKSVNGITDPTKLQVGKKVIIPENDDLSKFASATPTNGSSSVGGVSGPSSANSAVTQHQTADDPVVLRSVEPANDAKPSSSDDFFENFDEIPVVEIGN